MVMTHGATRLLTLVIVLAVLAVLFQLQRAVDAVPAIVAAALEQTVGSDAALAVVVAATGTALHRAVLSIPAGHAQTRAVLALAVLVAARIAQLHVAELALPAVVALTLAVHAPAVAAAVDITELQRAVVAAVLGAARAPLRVRVEFAVVRAVGQARNGRLVLDRAVSAGPALLADADALLGAEAVVRAGRVRTVDLLAELALVAASARALAADAVAVVVAVWK
jgi:hypothetical protein